MRSKNVPHHSVELNGRHTAITVEDQFWDYLRHIAIDQHRYVRDIVREINEARLQHKHKNLSAAIRTFVILDAKRRYEMTCGTNATPPTHDSLKKRPV